MTSHEKFFEEVFAQLDFCAQKFQFILREFYQAEIGDEISIGGRLATKELISSIKQILDQVTFRMWSALLRPQLTEQEAKRRGSNIYFPYGIDEQGFKTARGKMIRPEDTDGVDKRKFEAWLRAVFLGGSGNTRLTIVCELARLQHSKVIEQRKVRKFLISAFTDDGGGATIETENPTALSILLHRSEHHSAVQISGKIENQEQYISQYPNEDIQIITFDPEAMKFNTIPSSLSLKCHAAEILKCRVEDQTFDLIELFPQALAQVTDVVKSSMQILGSGYGA